MAGRPLRRARMKSIIEQVQRPEPVENPVPSLAVRRGAGRPKKTKAPELRLDAASGLPDDLEGIGVALATFTASDLMTGDTNALFEGLRVKALKFASDVMDLELDPTDRNFGKLLGVKQQIATSVLTVTTRVRPGDLREKEDDGLGRLLAKVKAGDLAGPSVEDLLN